MEKNDLLQENQRRSFILQAAAGAAAIGISMISLPMLAAARNSQERDISDADEWFKKVKGKHRIVFDVVSPNDILPFAWPRVFLMTNAATGSQESDCGVVVILRHDAIPYAMENDLWTKYKFGEHFKINDPITKMPSVRNMFWQPNKGDFKVPGIGEVQIGVNELQASGVMFCVCYAAMTVHSAVVAQTMNIDAATVKKEWIAGVLPGIQVVPSGVWAVGRAQEHGCAYCYGI